MIYKGNSLLPPASYSTTYAPLFLKGFFSRSAMTAICQTHILTFLVLLLSVFVTVNLNLATEILSSLIFSNNSLHFLSSSPNGTHLC